MCICKINKTIMRQNLLWESISDIYGNTSITSTLTFSFMPNTIHTLLFFFIKKYKHIFWHWPTLRLQLEYIPQTSFEQQDHLSMMLKTTSASRSQIGEGSSSQSGSIGIMLPFSKHLYRAHSSMPPFQISPAVRGWSSLSVHA